MNNTLHQKISQFLDNDLADPEALELLQAIHSDNALNQTYQQYAIISQVIKTGDYIPVKPDFVAQISARIEQEPYHFNPSLKKSAPSRYRWYAVAASVLALSVLVVHYDKQLTPTSHQASMLSMSKPTPPPTNKTASQLAQNQSQKPLNKRINDYLQAHNNSVYTSGETNTAASLTSVTSYNQK